jgi:hypothetical protein
MGWFSLLPENLSAVETWVVRLFLVLTVITIGPWAVLIIYDLLLYIWRAVAHEIPFVGGRARGRARPRAPSLTERPSGHPRHLRKFSLARSSDSPAPAGDIKPGSSESQERHIEEENERESPSI